MVQNINGWWFNGCKISTIWFNFSLPCGSNEKQKLNTGTKWFDKKLHLSLKKTTDTLVNQEGLSKNEAFFATKADALNHAIEFFILYKQEKKIPRTNTGRAASSSPRVELTCAWLTAWMSVVCGLWDSLDEPLFLRENRDLNHIVRINHWTTRVNHLNKPWVEQAG